MLHVETVLARTLDLLKDLQSIPELADMRLVGGTALALQLGHRTSVDLDLFGSFDDNISFKQVIAGRGHSVEGDIEGAVQTLMVDGVKVDLVNYKYPWLAPAIEESGVRLAAPDDIMPMKLSAAANRGRKKDFIDIATACLKTIRSAICSRSIGGSSPSPKSRTLSAASPILTTPNQTPHRACSPTSPGKRRSHASLPQSEIS